MLGDFRHTIIPRIVAYEHEARRALLNEKTAALDDKVFRALGLLRSARMLSSEEVLLQLSHLRMGVNLGRVKGVDINRVNELFLLTQQAHLQKFVGKKLEGDARKIERANFVRAKLGGD